ncbi:unnamed protein product, partial [Mycena citricolor]
ADFMYMAPPFMAYFAATSGNASLLQASYEQCGLYREVLLFGSNATTFSPVNSSATSGRWHHIVGPQSADLGLWSTGNGWAAAGMTRVLVTVMHAPIANSTGWAPAAISDLTAWIKEIIDGARASPLDNGLLRNYLDDTDSAVGFGETSGSALLASVVYRMVILAPTEFPAAIYVPWADALRSVLAKHVSRDGIAAPAVNPLSWLDPTPWITGSPEGQNFFVLLYAAWRDCIFSGLCKH